MSFSWEKTHVGQHLISTFNGRNGYKSKSPQKIYWYFWRKASKMRRKRKTITDIEALKAFLKSQKLKATPQRLMVHEAMMELGHASADMVADHIASN